MGPRVSAQFIRHVIVGVLGLSIGAAGGVFAAGLIPDANGVIHGCYQRANANLRVVTAPTECRQPEIAISWNQRGPSGATGATGPTGATGARGATGATGPAGQGGIASLNSLNGIPCGPTNAGTTRVTYGAGGVVAIFCDASQPPPGDGPGIVSASGETGATTATVTFSEPVYCTAFSFNATDIVITDNNTATTDPLVTGAGPNPCGVTQATADTSFSFTLSAPLLPSTTYTVILTPEANEVQDVAGNDLASPSSVTFTTAGPDFTPPTITDARVLNNVGPSTDFTEPGDAFSALFSERMNGSTTGTIDVQDQDGTTARFSCGTNATCTWNTAATTLTVTVVSALSSSGGTTPGLQIPATITVLGGFADTGGNVPNLADSDDLLIDFE